MAKELKDVTLRNIKPTDKDQRLNDGGGLYMLIKPNGAKWWRLDYTIEGKRKTISLGVYPDVSLSLAREKRQDYRQQIAQGIDPSQQRKNNNVAKKEQLEREQCIELGIAVPNSFEALAREWLDQKYSKETTPATLQKTTRQLELHAFPIIGAKPIKDLKSSDILVMLKPLAGDNKVETAHRIRTLCNSIFNYAIVILPRSSEHSTKRVISKTEVNYENTKNHSFKVEAVHGERFQTRSDAKYQVFEYIEVYYNRKRLHSKLGYISPEAFEAKKVA